MKLYKYRDFSEPTEGDFQRLTELLSRQAFWCARPATLNDPDELRWKCDCATSDNTIPLLAKVLVQHREYQPAEARAMAVTFVSAGRLPEVARPIFEGMIERCRNEIGLACFGSSDDNPVMWQRYGGAGSGICIEVTVTSNLIGAQLFPVEYLPTRTLHIDQLLRASMNPADRTHRQLVYSMALLSKSPDWASEVEIRFVSRRQCVFVRIDESRMSRVILGPRLGADTRRRIEEIVGSLSYDLLMCTATDR